MRLMKIVVFVMAMAFAVIGQTSTAVWTPEMQLKVKAVGAARVSPDAARVVYTVTNEVMTADKSEYVTQIWLATADGKENTQLTFADKTSTNPKWQNV